MSSALLTGVDISHVEYFERQGIIYRNRENQKRDLFQLMKNNHINLVRLRLFTASEQQAQADPYNYEHTLEHVLKLAHRTKACGLEFMLDFHYSDTWADPGHQTKPHTWVNLTFDQLVITLHNYTRESLIAFVKQNSTPEYVQIGNEITNGLLWPDGRCQNDSDWPRVAKLLQAASRAVREVLGKKTKVIVHNTLSTRWTRAKWFFDNAIEHIDFDVIGLSYYPVWHGNFSELNFCLKKLASHFNKPIFIVEIAYPWKRDFSLEKSIKSLTGFNEAPEGQIEYIKFMANILKNLESKTRQNGLVWWAPEYVTLNASMELAGFDRQGFFYSNGTVLPILEAFGQLPCLIPKCRIKPKYTSHFIVVYFPIITITLFLYFKYCRVNLNLFFSQYLHFIFARF